MHQIVSLAQFRKGLYHYTRYLTNNPQPLLITQKKGEPLVLVNGSIFEELLQYKLQHDLQYYENKDEVPTDI